MKMQLSKSLGVLFTLALTLAGAGKAAAVDNGVYVIRSYGTGLVMDVPAAPDNRQFMNGTYIQQFPRNGGVNQQFQLIRHDVIISFFPFQVQEQVEIRACISNKDLQFVARSGNNPALAQMAVNGSTAQRWLFRQVGLSPQGEKLYVIENKSLGWVIDVPFGVRTPITLQVFPRNNGTNQMWVLERIR